MWKDLKMKHKQKVSELFFQKLQQHAWTDEQYQKCGKVHFLE